MYELMGLLGLLATAAFIHGFVYRRRKYLIMFAVCRGADALHARLGHLLRRRRGARADPDLADAATTGAASCATRCWPSCGAGILFLPWLPNFIYQATHTGAPWAPPPRFGAPVLISRDLLGGDRITVALVLSRGHRAGALFTRRYRRTTRGDDAVGADRAPVRDAAAGVAGLADHARVRLAVLRAGPRPDPAAGRLGRGPRRDRRAGRDRRCRSCSSSTSRPTRRSTRATCATSAARWRRCCTRATGGRRPARADAARLVLPPAALQIRRHDRPGDRTRVHELGVRAQAPAAMPTRRRRSDRCLLASSPDSRCCSCDR